MATHQAPPSLGFSRQEHWSGLPFPSPLRESEKWKRSRSAASDSWRPHGLQPTRLLHPWDFPGKSTGVACHCLLHGMHFLLKTIIGECRPNFKTAKFVFNRLSCHLSSANLISKAWTLGLYKSQKSIFLIPHKWLTHPSPQHQVVSCLEALELEM